MTKRSWKAPSRPEHPLSKAVRVALHPHDREGGFGLLGLIVSLALSAAVVEVAYVAYQADARANDVSASTQVTSEVSQRVLASYASAADFSGLSLQSAEQINVFPKNTLKNGQPVDAWGGGMDLTAVNVAGITGPGNNNGFALTFEGVAQAACASFATNAGRGFQDVKVNNASVMKGTQVSATSAVTLCSQSPTSSVQFIRAKTSPNGPVQPDLTPCVPPPPGSQQLACPSGQLSSVPPYGSLGITQTNVSFCNSAYGPSGTSPWITASDTCVPVCVPPAPVVTPGSQNTACPSGQVTIAGGSPTFTQTNTQTTTFACPLPVGSATPVVGVPTPWTPLASAVCAPKCVAPPAVVTPGSITTACPAGQVTSAGATSFVQTNTQTTTYACLAPTGPATPTVNVPTAWAPSVSSVCAPKCTAPSPTTNPGSQTVGCPAGQVTASGASTIVQTRTQTVTYSCPAPQGSYTTTPGAWSAWSPPLSCSPQCVAPSPTSQGQTLGCPAGQTGAINQSRSVTYSCPAPTGGYATAYGAWGTTSNTCVTASYPYTITLNVGVCNDDPRGGSCGWEPCTMPLTQGSYGNCDSGGAYGFVIIDDGTLAELQKELIAFMQTGAVGPWLSGSSLSNLDLSNTGINVMENSEATNANIDTGNPPQAYISLTHN